MIGIICAAGAGNVEQLVATPPGGLQKMPQR
jgi:hypothetical protein